MHKHRSCIRSFADDGCRVTVQAKLHRRIKSKIDQNAATKQTELCIAEKGRIGSQGPAGGIAIPSIDEHCAPAINAGALEHDLLFLGTLLVLDVEHVDCRPGVDECGISIARPTAGRNHLAQRAVATHKERSFHDMVGSRPVVRKRLVQLEDAAASLDQCAARLCLESCIADRRPGVPGSKDLCDRERAGRQ